MLKDKIEFNPKKLMKGFEPSTEFNEVTQELARETNAQLHKIMAERYKAYNGMASRVVGAEYF